MRPEAAGPSWHPKRRTDEMAGRTRPTSEIAPLAVLRLAVWRPGRSFRLALAVGLGILVAVILIRTVPLYSSLVSNVALQQAMRLQLPPSVNIEAEATLNPASSSSVCKVVDQTRSSANQFLRRFASTSMWYLRVEYYFPPLEIDHQLWTDDPRYSLPPDPVLMPYAFDLPATLPQMHLVSSRLPEPTSSGQLPEVLVTMNMGGVKPSDTISISYHALTFKVVGVWTPTNVSDPYWNGGGSEFDSQPFDKTA